MAKIALLLIATHKYKQFVASLVEDVKKYFLPEYQIEVHLFTDDIECPAIGDERVKIIPDLIPGYRWPDPTLLRYKVFTSKEYPECSHLFYLDVDMKIVDVIKDNILGDIVAVQHPGFYKGGGSWETNEKSTSYTYPENRKKYYAGGFQGGATPYYYRAMQRMARDIEADDKNGITPIWHDESAWNKFLSECKSFKELTPRFCMVEAEHLRVEWGISHIAPAIIALDKDHKSMRE